MRTRTHRFCATKTRLSCRLQWSGYSRRNIRQDGEQMLSSGRSAAHFYKEAVHEEGWTANSQNDAGARFFIATKRVFREIIIAKTLIMRPYKKITMNCLVTFLSRQIYGQTEAWVRTKRQLLPSWFVLYTWTTGCRTCPTMWREKRTATRPAA